MPPPPPTQAGMPIGPPPPGQEGVEDNREYQDFTFSGLISGISFLLKDCLFYGGLIQFVLVTYMYIRVGKGRMWKIFFYGALSLFIGQSLEHLLMTLTNYKVIYKYAFASYIPLETFYIIAEYCIPFINFLKLKAVSRSNYTNKIKYLLMAVFPFFCVFRYLIGVFRFMEEDINPTNVRNAKGISASIIAVLDVFISILIIYELKQNLGMERMQNKYLNKTSVYAYIRKSNYAVLLLIDFVGFCLSFLSYSYVPEGVMDLVMPFQTLKDNFILILAVDAIIFKVDCFKMLSSGKTVGAGGKSSFTTSYNGTSYVNNTSMNNNSVNVNNYNNNSYGVLSNYNNNSSVNNYSSKSGGVLSSSQPLFSGGNKDYGKNITNPEFGSFHASNALNKLEESNSGNGYNFNKQPNYTMNYGGPDDKQYFNDIYSDSKASTAPLNQYNNKVNF